jgi:hypothetical protein
VLGAEVEQEAAEQGEGEHGEGEGGEEVGGAALVVVDAGAAHGAGMGQLRGEREEDGEDGCQAAHR